MASGAEPVDFVSDLFFPYTGFSGNQDGGICGSRHFDGVPDFLQTIGRTDQLIGFEVWRRGVFQDTDVLLALVQSVSFLQELAKILLQSLQGQNGPAADHHLVKCAVLVKDGHAHSISYAGRIGLIHGRKTENLLFAFDDVHGGAAGEELALRCDVRDLSSEDFFWQNLRIALMSRVDIETGAFLVCNEDAVVQRVYYDFEIDALRQKHL